MQTLTQTDHGQKEITVSDELKARLRAKGITQQRIAHEVKRIFPDRTCTKQMVNAVVNGRATSSFVDVAIQRLLREKAS